LSCASLQGMLVMCLGTPLVYIFFSSCMMHVLLCFVLCFVSFVWCVRHMYTFYLNMTFNALFLQILHIVTLLSHKSSQTRTVPNFCRWSCQYCTNCYNKNKQILTGLTQFTGTLISSMYFHYTIWFYKSTLKLCFV
jgi:hypothetical protein